MNAASIAFYLCEWYMLTEGQESCKTLAVYVTLVGEVLHWLCSEHRAMAVVSGVPPERGAGGASLSAAVSPAPPSLPLAPPAAAEAEPWQWSIGLNEEQKKGRR